MRLSEVTVGNKVKVNAISGNRHLLSRLIGVGLAEGALLQIVQNEKGQPVLFYCRDSVIALNEKDCKKIEVEEAGE